MEFLIKASELGLEVIADHNIGALCTYKVGGNAKYFVQVNDVAELQAIGQLCSEADLETLVVGKGSNLLVSDAGFDGLCVQLGKGFDYVEIDGGKVGVGGITFLPIAARKTAAAGLTGFEWAVGVPGSMGGAVRMNAGGHGSDMAKSLVSATVYTVSTNELAEVPVEGLGLSYRHSELKADQLVVSATLALEAGDAEASKAELSEIVSWRRANQPGGQNAGSVFANPEGHHAAKLIDDLGLKGFRIGTAEVSTKHANFIQADANGSADDVYRLIGHIIETVETAHGLTLRPENRLIGFQ